MSYKKPIIKSTFLYPLTLLFFILLIIISCKKDPGSVKTPDYRNTSRTNVRPDCRSCDILFIGSSYLSYAGNDVIEIFKSFSDKEYKNVYLDQRVISGWRLERHSQSPLTIDKINERKWDYIILQGNAAYLSQQKWHENIIPYLKNLRAIIKKRSKKTCVIYMMPWAYLDGLSWIEGETDTYEQMQINLYGETTKLAKDIDIVCAPVGWAWYTAIKNGYEADLYLNDNNHQSKSGAYLSACVFYSTIFLESAPEIPFSWNKGDDQQYLHALADSTVMNHLKLWNIY